MLIVFFLMAIPLTVVVIKNSKKKKLLDPSFRQKFGTLYTPCETHKGVLPLLFITIFVVRRLLVAIITGFM